MDEAGDFDQPFFDEINAAAGVTFVENCSAGGAVLFLGDQPQYSQLVMTEIAEQADGFEGDHTRTLRQNLSA